MKTCEYVEKYWLCPHSQRRRFSTWQNSGHPCFHSVGSWTGEIYCTHGYREKAESEVRVSVQNAQEAV